MKRTLPAACLVVFLVGCAHRQLTPRDLEGISRPAFIARIEEGAGPRSYVFRSDGTWTPRLKKLAPKEADRRLAVKLGMGMSRFEVSETLRAKTVARLAGSPWQTAVEPGMVAQLFESFLVEEVPANPPEYQRLTELGADAVVEFTVEEYGMRSDGGRAGAYARGWGRMFRLNSGGDVWYRSFRVDQLESDLDPIDPFNVAKEPRGRYRDAMSRLLDAVAEQFARDLNAGVRSEAREAERASPEGERPVQPVPKAEEDPL